MLKIAVLVLNYNGKRYLHSFMQSATFMRDDDEADLIVVDNASSDDSLTFLQENYPWVKIVRNKDNYGWGEGYNQAIAALLKGGHTYSHYMFLNNDVFPNPAWLSELKDAARSAPEDVGEIGCRSLFAAKYVEEDLFYFRSAGDYDRIKATVVGGRWRKVEEKRTKNAITLRIGTEARTVRRLFGQDLVEARLGYVGTIQNISKQSVTFDLPRTIKQTALSDVGRWLLFEAASTDTAPAARINLGPGERVVFFRQLSGMQEAKSIIQNSGLGLNRRFEGYDLHCMEDQSAQQDRKKIRGACGVCKLVTKEAFESVGGFDPKYFMYYEDLDFSLSLVAKGFRTVVRENAFLDHIHAGSTKEFSAFFNRQVLWSLYYFHFKHAGFFRRFKTYSRYLFGALRESFQSQSIYAKPMTLSLKKFKQEVGGSYLFGKRNTHG